MISKKIWGQLSDYTALLCKPNNLSSIPETLEKRNIVIGICNPSTPQAGDRRITKTFAGQLVCAGHTMTEARHTAQKQHDGDNQLLKSAL